ncbi:MAG: hypothetical protein C4519_12580 [Desulfobacteraceae bacterium]|nr:MAG: hypothetical protein C4519_12580 [Desulfobacteraceae bacterium]
MHLRAAAAKSFGVWAIIIFLAGCGGGGADSGDVQAVAYTGQSQAAVITPQNAKQIAVNILGEGDAPDLKLLSANTTDSSSLPPAIGRLQRIYRQIPVEKMRLSTHARTAASVPVNQTYGCPSGGRVTYAGVVYENGTGDIDVSYTGCTDGGVTINGSFHLRVDAYDAANSIETDATMSRVKLGIRGSGGTIDFSGSEHRVIDLATHTEQITDNLVVRNNITGVLTKSENLRFVRIFNDYTHPSHFSLSIEGRIFDGRYGYVDVETMAPLIFQSMSQAYPDAGARLHFTGAGGAGMIVSVFAGEILQIELDLDLDGATELQAFVPWHALTASGSNNNAPIAEAGTDRLSKYRKAVVLNGRASRDLDYDFLQYSWLVVEQPVGSGAELSDSNRSVARIIPDMTGAYRIRLTVSDGRHQSSDEIILTALETDPQDRLQQWHTYQGNAAHNGYVPLNLDPSDFSTRWSVTLGDGAALNPVTAGDNRVYATTKHSQMLYVINALYGSVVWMKDFGNIQSINPPAHANGRIYLQTGSGGNSFLWAFNAADATLAFRSAYGNQLSCCFAPTPYADGVYAAGGTDGGVYGFNAADGTRNWFLNLPGDIYKGCTPAVNYDHVFTFAKATLTVSDRITGEVEYTIPDTDSYLYGGMDGALVIGHNDNVLAIQGGRLTSFDLARREVGWQVGPGFSGQPVLSLNTIYAVNGRNLEARSEDTGALLWSWRAPSGYITGNLIVTNTLLFVSATRTTHAVDLTTHSEVWQYAASGHLALSNEGALLIATGDGRLIAVNVEGDHDGDGLPIWWERYYGLNDQDPSDAARDDDGDGLEMLAEFRAKSDPRVADSDGDGLSDGDEVSMHGSDPTKTDTDGDRIDDGDEVNAYATNPTAADSDGDGLDDAAEILIHLTNPNRTDSDGDGLDDRWEVANNLDPLGNDAADDRDADGLSNAAEYSRLTDPNDADTDDDHLNDGTEVNVFGTDPLAADTDQDQLRDDLELVHGLDPLDAADARMDSDGDRFSNLSEIFNASDLRDISSKPVASQWRTYQGNAAHTGYVPLIIDPADFSERWVTQLADRPRLNPVASGDGRIFVTTKNSTGKQVLYAIEAAGGSIWWERNLDDVGVMNPPAYADGRVYLQTSRSGDCFLWAFNAEDAAPAFRTAYKGWLYNAHAPTPFEAGIYTAGGQTNGTYGISAGDGSPLWHAETYGRGGSTPAADENYVFAFKAGSFATLAAIDRSSGVVSYAIEAPDNNFGSTGYDGPPVLGHLDNVLAIQGRQLISFDLNARRVGWQIAAGFQGHLALGPGVIYVLNDGALEVRNESNGDLLWRWLPSSQAWLTSNLVATENIVFAASADTTYAIDLTRQTDVWSYAAGGHLALGNEGALTIATEDGRLISIAVEPDTDNDRLPDSAEVNTYGTYPDNADSENDGMPDGWEVINRLDPLKDDSGIDGDGDGLINAVEFGLSTNPHDADTDKDELTDGDEVHTLGTDPLSDDTDGDHFSDYLELAHGFDPLDAADVTSDQDGDGYLTLSEVYNGTDPWDSSSRPVAAYWGTYQGNAAHTGYVPLIAGLATISERWAVTLGNGSGLNPIAAGDGRIYATMNDWSDNLRLYVMDEADGTVLWEQSFAVDFISPPAYAGGRIYLQTGGFKDSFLWAYNAADASFAFKSAHDDGWSSYFAPTPFAEGIYMGGGYYSGAYGFNATDGTQIWFLDLSQYGDFTPAVNQDRVFTYIQAALYVSNRATGFVDYSIPDPEFERNGWRMDGAPVIGHLGNVLVIQDGRLISFDLARRTIGWQIKGEFQGQLALGPGVIYAVNNGAVQARDERTGNLRWHWTPTASSRLTNNLVVAEDLLFASTEDTTYAVSLITHAEVFAYPVGGHLALSNQVLYIAAKDGRLIALFLEKSGE